MNSKTYVFFGNVGAGKGTQVLFLRQFLEKQGNHVVAISPGVEFRKITAKGSYSSGLIKGLLGTGKLFPSFLVSHAIANVLLKHSRGPEDMVIFDGFPRSVSQVEVFEDSMSFFGKNDIEVIHVEISKEEALRRLKLRERLDDTSAGITKRFEEYENNVIPTLEYLKQKGYKIHAINGEQDVLKVKDDIFKSLAI